MTATTASTTVSTSASVAATGDDTAARPRHLVRDGLLAGAAAAATNVAVAAAAMAADVSFELPEGGESIPLAGFAQITVIGAVIGIAIAAGLRRWATSPARSFVRVAVALTAVSLVPPLLVDAATSTVAFLEITHLAAAAIVIPAIARRLPR